MENKNRMLASLIMRGKHKEAKDLIENNGETLVLITQDYKTFQGEGRSYTAKEVEGMRLEPIVIKTYAGDEML